MQSGDPSSPANGQPPAIPDHTLLRVIGRGAYGEVWLARNVMGTFRAVKVIWRRQFESGRPYEREFAGIQRFEPVSRSSGGLVHVLHVGRNEPAGYFYYVMELADSVPGSEFQVSGPTPGPSSESRLGTRNSEPETYSPRTLRSDLKRHGRLAFPDCLRLASEVVSGLAQLHRQGLVHRDVKPGNIIYVHGRAKLADIGLVSSSEEGRTFVGTEGYIPPEGPGSPAADLYALGIALYEASTGNAPDKFPETPAEWFTDQAGGETLELHEIVLKACEGQRDRRYASAEAMQADLAMLQSGQSVRRARALERRYTRLRWSGVVGTVLLACALTAAFFENYRAKIAAEISAKESKLREQAQESLARAEAAEREVQQQLYTALLGEARAIVLSGELGHRVKALDALRRAAAISNNVELRREVFAALALPDLSFERVFPIGQSVTQARCDPAFEQIALCRGPGDIEIRSLASGELITLLPASTNLPAYSAMWSPDGRYLAAKRDHPPGGYRADWEIWEVSAARREMLIKELRGESIAFHPRSNLIVTARSNVISLWNLDRGLEVGRHLIAHEPRRLEISGDGKRFATVHGEPGAEVLSIFDTDRGTVTASWTFSDFVGDLHWHPDDEYIAAADHSGKVQLLDTATGKTTVLGRHKVEATTLAFSPGGDYLISGGWEREMICWDLQTRQRAFTIGIDSYHLQFSVDGQRCATLSRLPVAPGYFLELKLHAFKSPAAHREFFGDLGSRMEQAAFSSDGRWLAASGQKRVGLWNLASSGPGQVVDTPAMARLSFSPDGANLFGSGLSGEYLRWGVTTNNPSATPHLQPFAPIETDGFNSVCVISNRVIRTSPKGSRIMSLDDAVVDSHWIPTAAGLNGASADGQWLGIYRRFTPLLQIYNLPDLRLVAVLTNRANILAFDFSPQGDEIAVSTRQHVELWSTKTWERTRELVDFMRIFYHPDGRTVWLTKDYRTAGLFDARTLEPLLPLPTGMLPLAMSGDGRWLAVHVDSRKLQVWDVPEVRRQLGQFGLEWWK